MNCIISKMMTISVAFASTAFGMALTANTVDTFNWSGGQTGVANTEESPYDIWNAANWGGTLPSSDKHLNLSVTEKTYIKSENSSRICNDFCPNSGDFVFMGPLQFHCLKQGSVENSTVSIVKKSGDWTNKTYAMYIGYATSSTVVFTNESGNVNATGNNWHKIGAGAGSYAKVVNQSGDWTFNGKLILATAGGSTGIVENVSGDWSVSGVLHVANSAGYGEFTQYGGSLTVGDDMYINNVSTGKGMLTIKGGTVTVASNKVVRVYNGIGTINLDGGTLVAPQVYRNAGTFTLNFNGGTLKESASADLLAPNHDNMVVYVNAGGGVIDCGGYAVTLKSKIGSSGDTGSLTFTGGNIITIDNEVLYSGATRVTPGTILAISNATAKANILGNGLVVAGVPTAGQTIVTYKDTLTVDDYANISCPLAPTTTYKIGDDGMSIVVDTVGSHPDNFWTGAAGDNNLSTPGNWYNGVPTGNALIYSAAPARLTKGGSFAPTSITFFEDSSPVTIDGDFTTLTSVTNNSSVNQTFAGFVDFGSGNIDVTATAVLSGTALNNQTVTGGCVVFKGGVKGAKVANHSIVAGNYTLTSDEAFTNASDDASPFTVNENSSLSVKNAGITRGINICEGATFNVADFSNVDIRLCNWNKGTFIVTNFTYTNTGYFCLGGFTQNSAGSDANANAVLKAGTLTINGGGTLGLQGTGKSSGTTLKMYIGEGGLNIASGKAGHYWVLTSAHRTTMCPWNSDFTFGRGSSKEYDFLLGDDYGNGIVNFTLNTDDEAGVPRTITMDARICTATNTWTIAVAGHGTNVVTSASPLMTATYAVTDAATVIFDGTKKFNDEAAGFANGTISLDDGTTLEYTNVGNTLALPCSTLVLPESGKATLRINGGRLKTGDHILVEGVSAGATSLLNVELTDAVKAGRRYEVAEKDGNLVLSIASKGFILIVK